MEESFLMNGPIDSVDVCQPCAKEQPLCYCAHIFYIQKEKNATAQLRIVSMRVPVILCVHAATRQNLFFLEMKVKLMVGAKEVSPVWQDCGTSFLYCILYWISLKKIKKKEFFFVNKINKMYFTVAKLLMLSSFW